MISFGFDGFADVILSVVMRFCPAITSGYSRPNMDFTWRSASSIALRFSGFEKSVNGSFTNSPRSILVAVALAGDGVAGVDVDVMVGSTRCVNPDCSVRGEWRQPGRQGDTMQGRREDAKEAGRQGLKFRKWLFCCY